MSEIIERTPSPHSDSPEAGQSDVNATNGARKSCRKVSFSRRTDLGKLHRVRHGILSRDALSALVQLGEDSRTLRRMERQYRAALRPTAPFDIRFFNFLFDRFWSSCLRLMLIGRLETGLMGCKSAGKRKETSLSLVPGPQPTLVGEDPDDQPFEAGALMDQLPSDLLHKLVLVQRYDRYRSGEMYRALSMLLLLRRGGEAALESWASKMLGASQPRRED